MLLSYDVCQMKKLLESFYILTQMRIVVFDNEFNKIVEYPDQDCAFCSIIRQNPQAEEWCCMSDRIACEKCRQNNSLYSYTCHAGLSETVTPIKYGSIIIGYIMVGQVLQCHNMDEYWNVVEQRCNQYSINREKLREAYNQNHSVEPKQIYASAQLLEACAGYLWLQRYICLQEDTLPKQVDDYITNHLQADLSVKVLCAQFNISRSKLYKIALEYYGKSIEQIIRELRVKMAKELLDTTDHPVSEVSSIVGFDDYNYFIKVFKKGTGTTPVKYRKRKTEYDL